MLIQLLTLLILIIINGIFSATEIAFLSLNKSKLEQLVKSQNKKARRIKALIKDSSSFLSAIQIMITMSGFLASAFASEKFASTIASYFNITYISKEITINILIVIITIILSYFTLIIGELVPKKIGLAYSLEIALKMVNTIEFVIIVCKPFILILKSSTDFVLKLLKIPPIKQESDDIALLIKQSSLDKYTKTLFLNLLSSSNKLVSSMTLEQNTFLLINTPITKSSLLKLITNNHYDFYILIENAKIKGAISIAIESKNTFKISNYYNNILIFPKEVTIMIVLKMLIKAKKEIAIICDENKILLIITKNQILNYLFNKKI